MSNTPAPFRISKRIPPEQRLEYCIKIIDKYRLELRPLRQEVSRRGVQIDRQREKVSKLELEIKGLKEENRILSKEIKQQKEELDKLKTTNNRYQVSLFDSGNFKKQSKSGKPKGGQFGHADTNRESKEDTGKYPRQRIYAACCGKCGKELSRVNGIKQKQLIDLKINPEIIKLVLEIERQWCGNCGQEVNAKHEWSLPFTEYGVHLFMLIMYWRFKCKNSLKDITFCLNLFGVEISKAGVGNILVQAKKYLKGRYDELVKAIRDGEVMYNDETGWRVKGQKAWMWIMANEEATVYWAAESRGKGIFEEMYGNSNALSMHDGYTLYLSVVGEENSANCWAHVLRFAHEETYQHQEGSQGKMITTELVTIFHLKQTILPHLQKDHLEEQVRNRLNKLLDWVPEDEAVRKIQNRVTQQKQGLINALLYTPNGTNNLAEGQLRPMVMLRQTTNGSDSFTGMEITAILGSVVQTIMRQKDKGDYLTQMQAFLHQGIQSKYPQYLHPPSYDTS